MGIIRRQGLKSSLVSYIGVAIGGLSTLFIYPLDKEIYGYLQFLLASAALLIPFANLGVLTIIIKYKDRFDKIDKPGFFLFTGLITIFVFALFVPLYLFFDDYLFHFLKWINVDPDGRFPENKYNILSLAALLTGIAFMVIHANSNKRIVVPAIVNDFGIKLLIPTLVLLFYFGKIDTQTAVLIMCVFMIFIIITLFVYLISLGFVKLKWPRFDKYPKALRKELTDYSLFGSLNQLGMNLISKLDIIMVGAMLGMAAAGTYTILAFLVNIIAIPYRSILQISNPVVAQAFEENDKKEIKSVYQKSSIILMIAGVLLFLLIWNGVDDVFYFSKKGNEIIDYKYVFFFLGIGKIIDMSAGCNDAIIRYSQYYRWNLLLLLLAGGMNIFFNYFMILEFGLVGAAIASAVSLAVFNLLKFIFLKYKLSLNPFSQNTLKVLVLGFILFAVFEYVPFLYNPLVDLVIVSTLISITFTFCVYHLNISKDFNNTFIMLFAKARKLLKL